MPPAAKGILIRGTMARAFYKTAGFIREGIAGLVLKWPEWMIRNIYPVAISPDLRTRRAILEIIFSVVFVHPGALDKRTEKIIVVVFAESFPAMDVVMQFDQLGMFADGL